jgi:hydroxymethylbilane synthase
MGMENTTSNVTGLMRLGTRASPLAIAQTTMVRGRLEELHPSLEIEVVTIATSGDKIVDRRLSEVGGKGLFAKEIEEALLAGEIDAAVHSMKDLETHLPDRLCIGAVLPREDPRDAFIGKDVLALEALPIGAVVGTTSLRRQAQLLALRPDFKIVILRGNVGTRIDKIREGYADATLLAFAGLKRLKMEGVITQVISTDIMLPAVAQGAVGVEIRDDDDRARSAVAAINDADSALCVAAERAFLAVLDGSCHTPIGGLAELHRGRVRLRGLVARPDGTEVQRRSSEASENDALEMAVDVGHELRAAIGPDFFDEN